MAMTIMNDASVSMTLGELNKNISSLGKQLKKVSSGQRLNSAGDAASEFSISEKMRVRIRALDQDERNVQNGTSLLRVAEGAVQQQIEIMKTIKQKVIDADNDTNTDIDRATIQKEIDQGYQQIQNIAWETTYNGKLLLVGDTEIEEVSTWAVLDQPVTVPDSELDIIPNRYDSLDGETGPFDIFSRYTESVSTAAPLLGSNSSVDLTGGVNGYYDEPTTAQPATFTMSLSNYASADALDGVGFASGGRYYVLTKDTSKNYKTSGGNTVYEINISGCGTAADVAGAVANYRNSYGISGTSAASVSGTTITFKTSATGTAANTASPPITGWSASSSSVTSPTSGTPARRGRDAASATGLGSASASGTNAVTHTETYTVSEAYTDSNDVYHPAVTGTRTVTDVPATAATMTKNVSSVAGGSGITVNGACIRFVDGTSPIARQSDGTYTVGKGATVPNFTLYTWNNTIGSGGSSTGVTFSLSGGQMTLATTGKGSSYSITLTDGISYVAPQAATPGGTVTTNYEAVSAYSGDVSNATGGQNRGAYHNPVNASYPIDLTAYNTTDGAKLEEFIGGLAGKTMAMKYGSNAAYAKYEFVDTAIPSSMEALPQASGSAAVDLNALRTKVEGGITVADAFINLMQGKDASRFTNASGTGTKILQVNAYPSYQGASGNSVSLNISEGTLSQYTIDFASSFSSGVSIPDDLDGKGLRVYCATCDDQWFNFQFTMGGELDATRPESGSSGADLKTTLINVSEVTDVESLVQAFYDQAHTAMEDINHTLHVAANPKAGTVTFYDHRTYDVLSRPDLHPHAKEQGAKIADGVMDDVIKMSRGVYVKDLVIHHTDHASQNIHVRIPQTTLDHLFNYIEGDRGISEYNVMTAGSRDMLLGNMPGRKRNGTVITEEERGALDTALDYLTSANTLIGAQIMRLGMTENNIVTSRESTTASESTIRDADMAKEMTAYTKANVLAQAAQSMLAQANQNSSGILSLLQ